MSTAMAHRHGPQAVALHLLLQILLVVMVCLFLLPSSAGGAFTGSHTAAAVARVPCLQDQEKALLRLKRSFTATADSITAFRSWKAGTDCCGWAGVRCGDADGYVTSLDLGDWGMDSAGLDPALFDLSSLGYLNLAWNNFNYSELPSVGFERLTNLTILNLSNTNFEGQVPYGIGSLIKLVSLDLSTRVEFEEITGMGYIFNTEFGEPGQLAMPNFTSLLANLSSLRELHLGAVDLTQSADWCDALSLYTPNLRILRLPFCEVSGPICKTLSALHSLSVIDLQYNYMTGLVPDFFVNYSSLSVLQLSYNHLEGWVSPEIFEHKKLVTIDLHRNHKISGSLPNISADSCLQILLVGDTNFSGTIPSSIGKVKSLKRLGLDGPGFSGNLPSSIGELKSLNTLKVSGFNLVGPIPAWITNLTSLEVLQFSLCGLYGPIPSSIGHLIKLKTLAVQCKASGGIPPHIFNMTQLEELVLGSNNITGTMELNSLWRLPNLSLLDLSNSNIVVLDGQDNSSIVSFPNIMYLKLASCSLTKFPNILKNLNDCIGLDLSNNQMHGAIPRWVWEKWSTDFGGNTGLFFLNLSHNKFTSVGYETFLPIYSIKLDLSFNMFEGPIPLPQYFGSQVLDYSSNMFSSMPLNFSTQLGDTYVFKASQNNLSGNIPTSFCTVQKILDLSYNNFNGSIPSCLMEDANPLEVLNLKANQLDGELPQNININCTLVELEFGNNQIRGQLPRSLAACKNLEHFDIQNNQINDSFPCWMSTLARLQVLVLKGNKFFGQVGPSSSQANNSCDFPSLRILDLASNNFSGALTEAWVMKLKSMIHKTANETLVIGYEDPSVQVGSIILTYKGSEMPIFTTLGTLVFIDISNNAFWGRIPQAMGELVLLKALNVSHNYFTGSVPSQLAHLRQLEALDLSFNEFGGEIPYELSSLDFLTTLNLSYNRLTGRIPESPHFMTFSNSSFLGNDLCGLPLSKECNDATAPNVVPRLPVKKQVDIILFLFVGLGFGLGFAAAVVATPRIHIRK